jgi:hypothetical protein
MSLSLAGCNNPNPIGGLLTIFSDGGSAEGDAGPAFDCLDAGTCGFTCTVVGQPACSCGPLLIEFAVQKGASFEVRLSADCGAGNTRWGTAGGLGLPPGVVAGVDGSVSGSFHDVPTPNPLIISLEVTGPGGVYAGLVDLSILVTE